MENKDGFSLDEQKIVEEEKQKIKIVSLILVLLGIILFSFTVSFESSQYRPILILVSLQHFLTGLIGLKSLNSTNNFLWQLLKSTSYLTLCSQILIFFYSTFLSLSYLSRLSECNKSSSFCLSTRFTNLILFILSLFLLIIAITMILLLINLLKHIKFFYKSLQSAVFVGLESN